MCLIVPEAEQDVCTGIITNRTRAIFVERMIVKVVT